MELWECTKTGCVVKDTSYGCWYRGDAFVMRDAVSGEPTVYVFRVNMVSMTFQEEAYEPTDFSVYMSHGDWHDGHTKTLICNAINVTDHREVRA